MSPKEIHALRTSLAMTQTDLAHYLGLRHKSQVSHLESGRTPATGPVLRLLELLCDSEGRILSSVRPL